MTPTRCPHCAADLSRGLLPSRVLPIYDPQAGVTVAWSCPDCGGEWGAQLGLEDAEELAASIGEAVEQASARRSA